MKKLLNLLLVDSEIETVPPEIANHPAVRISATKRKKPASQILLDATLHHSAMKRLEGADRRGRPDIVHFFLLLGLESVLSRRGLLRVFVHTRNDELIAVDPTTRLPKNYPRFVGLMESLFMEKAVPSRGAPLLKLSEGYSFKRCLDEIPHSEVVVFSEQGKRIRLSQYFRGKEDLLCVIGGFSKGDFISDVYSGTDEVISIFEEPLTVWTVESELIVNYENALMKIL
jgi:rRNA small subunit pseudouridine methyltransferase Nep1